MHICSRRGPSARLLIPASLAAPARLPGLPPLGCRRSPPRPGQRTPCSRGCDGSARAVRPPLRLPASPPAGQRPPSPPGPALPSPARASAPSPPRPPGQAIPLLLGPAHPPQPRPCLTIPTTRSARGKAKALAAPPPDDDDFQQRPASQPTRPSRPRPEVQRYKASSQGGGRCKGQS